MCICVCICLCVYVYIEAFLLQKPYPFWILTSEASDTVCMGVLNVSLIVFKHRRPTVGSELLLPGPSEFQVLRFKGIRVSEVLGVCRMVQ